MFQAECSPYRSGRWANAGIEAYLTDIRNPVCHAGVKQFGAREAGDQSRITRFLFLGNCTKIENQDRNDYNRISHEAGIWAHKGRLYTLSR